MKVTGELSLSADRAKMSPPRFPSLAISFEFIICACSNLGLKESSEPPTPCMPSSNASRTIPFALSPIACTFYKFKAKRLARVLLQSTLRAGQMTGPENEARCLITCIMKRQRNKEKHMNVNHATHHLPSLFHQSGYNIR